MANLHITRVEKVQPNRDAAIKELDKLCRVYGEFVAIKYYDSNYEEQIITSIYKSCQLGDYEITYDSGLGLGFSAKVHTITKRTIDQDYRECIFAALGKDDPVEYDIVIIFPPIGTFPGTEGGNIITYIYSRGDWYNIVDGSSISGGSGTSLSIETINTESISLSLIPDGTGSSTLSANLNVDGDNLIIDKDLNVVRVAKIYGGSY